MEKENLIAFWRTFFSDLFVGTFKRLIVFSASGFGIAGLAFTIYNWQTGSEVPPVWSDWLSWTLAGGWFLFWGILQALLSCAIFTVGRKFSEVAEGLHALLDLLTRQVMAQFSKTNKVIPRAELEASFENFGQKFLESLRLKGGITPIFARIIFGFMIKALKFFFLDNVMTELSRKNSDQIRSSDIEHAVRRVGVDIAVSPIRDQLEFLQILNLIFLLFLYAIPFVLVWIF
jgi:hypothetical protein